jgi:hypothetical protein
VERADAVTALHLLADNEDLPEEDYRKAAALLATVRDLHLQARAYIARERLDAEIFLPGSVWATLVDHDSFLEWSYDLVNQVKLLSPFSGFHPMMWGRLDVPADSDEAIDGRRAGAFYTRYQAGQVPRAALPALLEREFDLSGRMRRSAPALIDQYDALTDGVPERYHVCLPARAGEIGIRHRGRIIHSDLIAFQSRMNALYGGGALQHLEAVVAREGRATYGEIGAGAAQFANALRDCFDGRLDLVLIDLPPILANACAYLSCTAGPDAIGLVTADTAAPLQAPIVGVANYLVPAYERHLPAFDLVHNANSLNEMNDRQVACYMELVRRHLAPGGCFHLSGTFKLYDYHKDVPQAAAGAFPRHHLTRDGMIGGVRVVDPQHMFCYG